MQTRTLGEDRPKREAVESTHRERIEGFPPARSWAQLSAHGEAHGGRQCENGKCRHQESSATGKNMVMQE